MHQRLNKTSAACLLSLAVVACGGGGSSADNPPDAPTDLKVFAGKGQTALSWAPVARASAYNVFASTKAGTQGVLVGSSSSAAFVDSKAVTNGTTYYYTVVALATGLEGPASAQSGPVTPMSPAVQKIPNTGQTASYAAGDNGTHADINPMNFADLGDGTVSDKVTGLMWQKQDSGEAMNWYLAVPYCAGLSLGGHKGWRLPSELELQGIVNYGTFFPAITSAVFPGTQSASYFSSTVYEPAPSFAWLIPFYDATVLWGYQSAPGYARCVRLGAPDVQSFNDNSDGTITDNVTGVMWQKQDDAITRNWGSAVSYCSSLALANHRDWRLPTIKELNSISDFTTSNPAINTTYFPATAPVFYWSSTSYAYATTSGWGVAAYDGSVYNNDKSYPGKARCARQAQ